MFAKFEMDQIKKQDTDIARNFSIVDGLYDEAVELGIFPLENPLDGLDAILKIARVVNSVPGTPR